MVAVPGRIGSDLLDAADAIAASTGSACHSGVNTPAATLLAMGIDADDALGALRLTLGRSTTDSDLTLAAESLTTALATTTAAAATRRRGAGRSATSPPLRP